MGIIILVLLYIYVSVPSPKKRIVKPKVITAGRPKISTTIYSIYSLTKLLVGDKVEVVLLLPSGVDTHHFEPGPATIENAQNSRLILSIGHGIDPWANKVSQALNIKILPTDQGISLIQYEDKTTDPHYFLSLKNMAIMATFITSILQSEFPSDTQFFQLRSNEIQTRLKNLDTEITEQMKKVENKNIATLHDAWGYLARDYGINIVGSLEPEGRDITPKELVSLLESIKKYNVKVVFSQPAYVGATLEKFARENGLQVVYISPIESQGSRNDDVIRIFENNMQTIIKALH